MWLLFRDDVPLSWYRMLNGVVVAEKYYKRRKANHDPPPECSCSVALRSINSALVD